MEGLDEDLEAPDPTLFNEFGEDRAGYMAAGKAVSDIDHDPEQAARALHLSKYSNTPAEVISGDLEGFERNDKTQLVGDIIKNNPTLRNYVLDYPMASKISNDDYPRIADAHKSIEKLLDTWPQRALDRGLAGLAEGFGEAPLGPGEKTVEDLRKVGIYRNPESPGPGDFVRLANEALINPSFAAIEAVFRAFPAATHAIGNIVGGVAHDVVGTDEKGVAREVTGMLDWLMTRGDMPLHPPEGKIKAEYTPRVKDIMFDLEATPEQKAAAKQLGAYIQSGELPPPGTNPLFDKLHSENAKTDAKDLLDAVKQTQATATHERSLEASLESTRAALGEQKDREIGITPAAVRELYGEKLPEEGDNVLGYIPDLAEQLRLAEQSGADIKVPLADFLVKTDPAVAKALEEHLRVREDGMTLKQAKEFGEREKPKEGEFQPSTPTTPEDLVRREGSFDVLADRVKQQVRLKKITEEPDPNYPEDPPHSHFAIMNEFGKKVGDLQVQLTEKNVLYVPWIGGYTPGARKGAREVGQPHVFGLHTTESLFEQLAAEYPTATHVGGYRVTGARGKAGSERWVQVPLERFRRKPEEAQKFLAMVEGWHGSPHEFDAFSMEKIGTGEGAQAYGHGLYFAENQNVASSYRKGTNIIKDTNPNSPTYGLNIVGPEKGAMYKVRLHVNKEDLLDFDKPLEEQAPGVRNLIPKDFIGTDDSGKSFLIKPSDAKDSKALLEAGIPGLKYLDEESRAKGEGTHNIVMFGAEHIEIVERNGEPLPPKGLADAKKEMGWDKVETAPEVEPDLPGTITTQLPNGGTIKWQPQELWESKKAEVWEAISKIADQIAPGVNLILADKIITQGQGMSRPGKVGGFFSIGDKSLEPYIVVAYSEFGTHGTLFHEVIHHLRQGGFFKESEWAILEKAARDNDWIGKHEIRQRYPHANEELMLEEAIAEQYKKWVQDEGELKGKSAKEAAAVFAKLKEFFDKIKEQIERIFGKDITFDRLFTEVSTGEIGQRQPGMHDEGRTSLAQTTNAPELKIHDLGREGGIKKELWNVENDKGIITSYPDYDAGVVRIKSSRLKEGVEQRQGFGTELYKTLIDEASSRGLAVESDERVSVSAKGVYDRLKREGYDVKALDDGRYRIEPRTKDFGQVLAEATRDEEAQMFEKGSAFGLTQDSFKRWMKKVDEQRAETEARAKARAEQMETIHKSQEWKDNETAVMREVVGAVHKRPDIMADDYFRRGIFNGEKVESVRFGTKFLSEEQKKILGAHMYEKAGINPADAAGLFGFDNGEALIKGLTDLANDRGEMGFDAYKRRLIKQTFDQEMAKRYGQPEKDAALKEAREDILSDSAMDMLYEEYLAAAYKAKEWNGVDQPAFTVAGMKEAMALEFGRLPVGRAKDMVGYLRTAGRAGDKAMELMLKDDAKGAFKEKQHQFIAALLAQESKKFNKELKRAQKQFDQLSSKNVIKSMDQDYTDQLHRVMEQIGEGHPRAPQELKSALEGKSLEQFVDAKHAELREIPVADFLLDPAYSKKVKDMPVDEFRAVWDSVQSMVHNAKEEKQLTIGNDKAELEEMVDRAKDQTSDMAKVYHPRNPSAIDRLKRGITSWDAALLKAEQLFDWLDREDPNGIFNRAVFRAMSDSKHVENDLRKEIGAKLKANAKTIKGIEWDKQISHPELTDWRNGDKMHLTERDLVGMILNMGTEIGEKKLTSKFKFNKQEYQMFTPTQARAIIVANARKEHWDFAQAHWKIYEDLWPRIEEMTRELSGIAPDKRLGRDVDTSFGVPGRGFGIVKGGYYPLIADQRWTGEGVNNKGVFGEDKYMRAIPPKGYTKKVTTAQYPLDLNPVFAEQRINETIHDLAFRKAIINADKFLRQQEVRTAINDALGPEYMKQIDNWLQYVANPSHQRMISNQQLSGLNSFARVARERLVAVQLLYRASTVLKHSMAAILDSTGELSKQGARSPGLSGIKEFMGELAHYYAQPWKTVERVRAMMAESGELRNRLHDMDRDIGEMIDRNLGESGMKASMVHWGGMMVSTFDLASAVPTYSLAKKWALARGLTEEEAIYAGEKAVRAAHGSAGVTDLAAVMRGPEMLRVWTVAYSFFNHSYNRIRNIGHLLGNEGVKGDIARGDMPKAWEDFKHAAWMSTWYIVLMGAAEEAISPLLSNEDIEHESWIKFVGKGIVHQLMGTQPFLRNLSGKLLGTHHGTSDPIQAVGESILGLYDIAQKEAQGKKVSQPIRHTVEGLGYLFGIPGAGQLGVTGQFLWDMKSGRQRADSILLGRGLGTNVLPFGSGTLARGVALGRSEPYRRLR